MPNQACPHCGQDHRPGAKFCPVTGKVLCQESGVATPLLEKSPESAAPVIPAPIETNKQDQSKGSPAGLVVPDGPNQLSGIPGVTGKLPPNSFLHNRYIVLRKVGHGGMAAVYQAADTQQPGSQWAIKEMSDAAISNLKDRQYAVQAFKQEANFLQRLVHPNLPRVNGAFTESGKHYLVMEFIQGQPLQALIERKSKPYTQDEVLQIAVQLCDVLKYLHRQTPPIIFRDLKPSNIMMTPEGQVKLIDFGIARFFKPGQKKDTLALGTPGYASPEAAGGQTDERSDLYSLCVTLHQMLTLHDPCKTMFNLPPARTLNPLVTVKMEAILICGLQNDREKRWHNVLELERELLHLIKPTAMNRQIHQFQEVVTPEAIPSISSSNAPALIEKLKSPGELHNPLLSKYPEDAKVKKPALKVKETARPTTRLLIAATQLSNWQLILLVALLLVLLVAGAWILSPILTGVSIEWNNIPIIAIFGPLGYATLPKRGITFGSHFVLSTGLVATIWARLGSGDFYGWEFLLIAVLVSGLVMEGWVSFLPKINPSSRQVWVREVIWIAAMSVLGSSIFFLIVTKGDYGMSPIMWILSGIIGTIGWFIGDLIQQYVSYKRTGLWQER